MENYTRTWGQNGGGLIFKWTYSTSNNTQGNEQVVFVQLGMLVLLSGKIGHYTSSSKCMM